MLLTPAELADLTGKQRQSAQRRVLDFLAIPYEARTGVLKVRRYDVLSIIDPGALKRGEIEPPRERISDLWSRYVAGIDGFYRVYRRGERLPNCSGVYLMIDDGAVHYVGQTVNIHMRMIYHWHAWWREIAVIEMPEWWPEDRRQFWLDGVESLAMDYFKPAENVKIAPGIRGPAELIAQFDKMPQSWRCR
jgi:hypothetical protein